MDLDDTLSQVHGPNVHFNSKVYTQKKIHNCHNFIKYTKKILYLIVNIFDIVHAGTFYKLAGYQNLTYEKT